MSCKEPDPTFADKADEPKTVAGDQGRIDQHSLADQIAFDKYVKKRDVSSGNAFLKSIYAGRMLPPSARGT